MRPVSSPWPAVTTSPTTCRSSASTNSHPAARDFAPRGVRRSRGPGEPRIGDACWAPAVTCSSPAACWPRSGAAPSGSDAEIGDGCPGREHDGCMSTSLVIVSDTHIPKRARDLPTVLWNAIESADLVIHAGDWVEVALLDELEARSARLVGVVGNNDGPDLRSRLPEVANAVVDGMRFSVVN